MPTEHALICHGTKRRLYLGGLGIYVECSEDGAVTDGTLIRSHAAYTAGSPNPQKSGAFLLAAAKWVRKQGGHRVQIVSEYDEVYDRTKDYVEDTL